MLNNPYRIGNQESQNAKEQIQYAQVPYGYPYPAYPVPTMGQ